MTITVGGTNITLNSGSVIQDPIGSAPSYLPRAWVNFNGTGTVAIRASGNVSSITDNGTGNYTVNFTTAMANTNYAIIGTARSDTDGSGWSLILSPKLSYTKTTSAIQFAVMQYNMPLVDSPEVDVFIIR